MLRKLRTFIVESVSTKTFMILFLAIQIFLIAYETLILAKYLGNFIFKIGDCKWGYVVFNYLLFFELNLKHEAVYFVWIIFVLLLGFHLVEQTHCSILLENILTLTESYFFLWVIDFKLVVGFAIIGNIILLLLFSFGILNFLKEWNSILLALYSNLITHCIEDLWVLINSEFSIHLINHCAINAYTLRNWVKIYDCGILWLVCL